MPTVVFPTLAQIRARVRFYIDEPVQANFQDSDLNWAINQAQQTVATEIAQVDEKYFVNTTPTLLTTVANQRFYALPTDFWKMLRLEDNTTGLRLEFAEFNDMDNFLNNNVPPLVSINQAGYSASIIGNSIALTPTPSASGITANFWYVPILPDMTSDSDTSQIPRQFIDLLAIQAGIDAKIKDEDDTGALAVKYNQLFQQLVRSTRDRQQQNPKKVTRVASPSTGWTL